MDDQVKNFSDLIMKTRNRKNLMFNKSKTTLLNLGKMVAFKSNHVIFEFEESSLKE
jgi:hypothetical protein